VAGTFFIYDDPDEDEVRVKFAYNPAAVDAIKTLPRQSRHWDGDEKTWFVDREYLDDLIELFESLGMTCANVHPPPHSRYQTPPPGSPFNSSGNGSAKHWDTLWLKPGAPPEVVDAAYKALIRKHHPDAGGDATLATVINVAYHELRKK
jgi:hypothetical protein